MGKSASASGWNTHNEIGFLRELGNGKHSHRIAVLKCSRAEMLERYIGAAALRRNWGNINTAEVLMFAYDLLHQCQRGKI